MSWVDYVKSHSAEAEALFSSIGIGHANAVSRPLNEYADRVFRRMIEEANNTDDCIINTGKGYFRPDLNDEIDRNHLKHYYFSEIQRGSAICVKANRMLDNIKERDPEAYKIWEEERMA